MWTANMVTEEFAKNVQVDAGLLLNTFDPANPRMPTDEEIISATTGDFTINLTPTMTDFFADVNGAPADTMEGKRIDSWAGSLAITLLEITEETLKTALGAAGVTEDGLGITARRQLKASDFKGVYWMGDMVEEDKVLVVALDNAVSTGGVSFTSTKNGKGKLSVTLTPHASTKAPQKVPMAFYILEKVEEDAPTYTYSAVTPAGSENPKEEGWYVLNGDKYQPTNDTAVDSNKTYYERVAEA